MKITVLYQNYNQSEYIEESMNAILNQTYQAYEIIMSMIVQVIKVLKY